MKLTVPSSDGNLLAFHHWLTQLKKAGDEPQVQRD